MFDENRKLMHDCSKLRDQVEHLQLLQHDTTSAKVRNEGAVFVGNTKKKISFFFPHRKLILLFIIFLFF